MNFPFVHEKWQSKLALSRTVPFHIKVTFIKLAVSASRGSSTSKCQAWIYCGRREAGVWFLHPLWITALPWNCAVFPLSASLLIEGSLPHTWAECSVVARKPGLLNADFMEVAQEKRTVTFRVICMKSDFTRHEVSSLADDASFVLL